MCATLVCAFFACAIPAYAQSGARIDGIVVDASSGVALSGATVRIVQSSLHATTDARGAFAFTGLDPGTYRLAVEREDYQPALSTPVTLRASGTARTTLAMQRAVGGLHTIAVTSTRASASLQESSTFTQTINTEALQSIGAARAGDTLRTLSGVNNGITGDTAALGDDINLNIRGIGTAETVAALDGHPIGYGIKGGFNYQLSPLFPFQDVQVLYGSGGSNILGVTAIGGVVNFRTLNPTPTQRITFTQGYGSFQRLASSLTATGSAGRLGYAFAYGVSGLDGPIRHANFYQVGASSDPSAPAGSTIYDNAIYTDDSSVASRAALVKFTYALDAQTNLTLTDVNSSYWEDKTGNGDGDYMPYATALAQGDADLAAYDPATAKVACPSGQFYVKGNNYPVDGQIAGCQTPAQYATLQNGWLGAGPAWQAFNFGYQDAVVTRRAGGGTLTLDAFTTLYNDTTYRLNLPTPSKAYLRDYRVQSSGSIVDDDFASANNDAAFGYSYLNNAYIYSTISTSSSFGAPYSNEGALFVRDVYAPQHGDTTAFFNLWAKHASQTDSSYLDPRLSIVMHLSPRNVLRAAAGATTTEPTSDELDLPFTASSLGQGLTHTTGGGATFTCGTLNSIGSIPSSDLKPERGVDEEAAFSHIWSGDSIAQLQLYSVNVYDKLYSVLVPLSQVGSAGIDPAAIALAQGVVAGCPSQTPLGVTGTVNVGTLKARGIDLSGRQRFTYRFYADYDWALTSSILASAPAQLLESNLTDVLGSQIKGVPLHTGSIALDNTFGTVDARYTAYFVSAGNTKNLPAYNYSSLQLRAPLSKSATLTVAVFNLFQQYAFIQGLVGQGQPAQLNAYATAGAYAPYIGAAATEEFGLPYRSIYVSVQFRR
ncbi:MAG TPA: TonB-dependent receptor [Candidatus Acidoferrales bacterium]|nr:TonB-dependent receptor [Candidatus Acidoferrales bacterium]